MSGDFTQVCVPSGGGGSGINVDALPPLPDPEVLDAQVQSMIFAGVGFHNGVQDAARNWAGLRAFYRTPDAEQVLGAFTPALAKAARVKDLTGAAARALYGYADRARDFKRRITGLRAEVQALDAVILANDDWHSKAQIVDTHQQLMSSASGLAQAILDSDTQCANELSALTHGPGYTPVEVPRRRVFASTDQVANGFSWLQHQLGTDAVVPDLPWGPAVSIRHEGRLSAVQGFGTAAVGAVQGLYTLFGTKDKTQQAQAWQGVGALGAAVFRSKAVIDRGFTDMDEGDIEALLTAAAAIRETVHADEWATDYWRAGGQTAFDLATAATGGAGGGLTLEARITALTNRLRGLPTTISKTTTITEAGAGAGAGAAGTAVPEEAAAALGTTATKSSAVLGSATAAEWAKNLDTGIARVQEFLTTVGRTIEDYNNPAPATAGIPTGTTTPGVASAGTGRPGPATRWLNEHHTNPTPGPTPATRTPSQGRWSDDIKNRARNTPAPETGPNPSPIDRARLNQRLNPTTTDPVGVPHTHPEPPGGSHTGPDTSGAHQSPESPPPAAEHAPPTASPAKPPGPPGTYDQRLGDHTLPGRHPDLQPTIGDTDGGPGTWQEPVARNSHGVSDQIFATGVTSTGPKGNLLEYVMNSISARGDKKSIAFDGHLWRGRPPLEIFQEIKGNYDLIHKGIFNGQYLRNLAPQAALKYWVETARKQLAMLEAKAPGSQLEWVFTHNPEFAEMLDKALRKSMAKEKSTVSFVVKYVPLEA
ncbi:hypothetical protein ACIPY3_09395 [Paenarthrobacter sp. NPDC089714]|uniref:hypothetical protein n=1 Tax=Paenarthrobacter sp. NPDC089714 TaxID=3364377 RepID=UPI00382696FF